MKTAVIAFKTSFKSADLRLLLLTKAIAKYLGTEAWEWHGIQRSQLIINNVVIKEYIQFNVFYSLNLIVDTAEADSDKSAELNSELTGMLMIRTFQEKFDIYFIYVI